MDATERWDTFRDVAKDSLTGLDETGLRVVKDRVERLSDEGFADLCASFRAAEVRSGMGWLARRLVVYLVAGGLIAWSLPRLAAAWALVLALVGAALVLLSICLDTLSFVLLSICLDTLSFVRLERRCLKGLGLSVVDVLLLGPGAARIAREFHDGLDDAGGSLA